MSALGQKRTFAVQKVMSALPPKADMCGANTDVRFGPKADIRSAKRHVRHKGRPIRSPRRRVEETPLKLSVQVPARSYD
jgi:hypothetical protein